MSGGTCGDNSVVSVYNGAFDPNNRATNYLTDAGEVGITRPASVVLTKGQTVTVVITGADPSLDCTIAADADDPSLVFAGNLDATSLTMSGRVTRDGVEFHLQCDQSLSGRHNWIRPPVHDRELHASRPERLCAVHSDGRDVHRR